MRSWVWLILVACTGRGPSIPAVTPPGVIEGVVVDTTGIAVGATMIATTLGTPSTAVTLADESGRYRLSVAPGRWDLVVHYGDATIEIGAVTVRSARTTRRDVQIPYAVDTEEPMVRCPAGAATDPAARGAVVGAVLARLSADRRPLLDAGRLPKTEPIYLRVTPDGMDVRATMLGGQPLVMRSQAALQAEADRRDVTLHFLELHRVEVAGDCATVVIGIGMVTPARKRLTHLCCCSRTELWEQRDGRWQFRVQAYASCA